jgi:hypothetical protein
MAVKKHGSSSEVKEFVEEMVVRRELSDNFCYYNENYDSLVIVNEFHRKCSSFDKFYSSRKVVTTGLRPHLTNTGTTNVSIFTPKRSSRRGSPMRMSGTLLRLLDCRSSLWNILLELRIDLIL